MFLFAILLVVPGLASAQPKMEKLVEYTWIDNNLPIAGLITPNHQLLLSESYLVSGTKPRFSIWQRRRDSMINFLSAMDIWN